MILKCVLIDKKSLRPPIFLRKKVFAPLIVFEKKVSTHLIFFLSLRPPNFFRKKVFAPLWMVPFRVPEKFWPVPYWWWFPPTWQNPTKFKIRSSIFLRHTIIRTQVSSWTMVSTEPISCHKNTNNSTTWESSFPAVKVASSDKYKEREKGNLCKVDETDKTYSVK